MTGTTLAKVAWRALDREGDDKCRLAQLDTGYMLVGHARFRDGIGWAALDYVVRTDQAWRTTTADITGEHGGDPVAWKLEREGHDWWFNGAPQPALHGAEDVDLSFTPATNLMPLRRLPQVGRLGTVSVWLRLPGPNLGRLTQSYTRGRGSLVHYSADETGHETQLEIDAHGFVTEYPGLWTASTHD